MFLMLKLGHFGWGTGNTLKVFNVKPEKIDLYYEK
jgi:hypothetical protein